MNCVLWFQWFTGGYCLILGGNKKIKFGQLGARPRPRGIFRFVNEYYFNAVVLVFFVFRHLPLYLENMIMKLKSKAFVVLRSYEMMMMLHLFICLYQTVP